MCQWKTWLLALALILGSSGASEAQTLFRMDVENDDFLAFLGSVDLATLDGETHVGDLGSTAQRLAYDPTTGDLFAYDADTGLLRVDATTGVATVIGLTGVDVEVKALTVDTNGTPWALASAPSGPSNPPRAQLLSLNPTAGTAATVLDLGDPPYEDLAAVGTRLVALDLGGALASLVDIDPATGQATVGASVVTPGIFGITSGPNHDSLIALSFTEIFLRGINDVDPDTGEATFLGDIGVNDSINAGSFLADIAVAPARGITDVPTLGGFGIAVLATLLALAGLLVQRRG